MDFRISTNLLCVSKMFCSRWMIHLRHCPEGAKVWKNDAVWVEGMPYLQVLRYEGYTKWLMCKRLRCLNLQEPFWCAWISINTTLKTIEKSLNLLSGSSFAFPVNVEESLWRFVWLKCVWFCLPCFIRYPGILWSDLIGQSEMGRVFQGGGPHGARQPVGLLQPSKHNGDLGHSAQP